MRIIPVIDILDRVVVRGVAGERDRYRPVESLLVDSAEPLQVATAIREHYQLHDLYVADLDGILHGTPNWTLYRELKAGSARGMTPSGSPLPRGEGLGVRGECRNDIRSCSQNLRGELLIDAGVKHPAEALAVLEAGADRMIVGLESCRSPEVLAEIVSLVGSSRVVFSLDLKAGRSLGGAAWPLDPLAIVHVVIAAGVQTLIVLDLAGVGIAQGVPTLPLCRQVRSLAPNMELITGGGVRDAADLALLKSAGIDGVLIASALHQRATWLKNDESSISG